jgi:hypothetical protein
MEKLRRDTVPAVDGKSYQMRNGVTVGPLRRGRLEMEDHFVYGGLAWHSGGDACGSIAHDLIKEL